jgi:hypothetical protein
MMYLHTPEYQAVLQAAVKLRHLEETDEDIAFKSRCGGKMTVQRFRTAKLIKDQPVSEEPADAVDPAGEDQKYGIKTDGKVVRPRARPRPRTLKLDHPAAVALWNYCSKQVKAVVQERSDLLGHTERLAANAITSFYRAHESQTVAWRETHGLQREYFLYKPSFRIPGNLVKSHVRFTLSNSEYFEVSEKQSAKTDEGWESSETSTGFAISKSEHLWLFLREESREQPRILCLHGKDFDEKDRISRLSGYVLESDKRFTGGVYMFRVGLVSLQLDKDIWDHEYPGIPYDVEEQIDNVRFPKVNPARRREHHRVVFDQRMLNFIRPDILKSIDAQAFGGRRSATPVHRSAPDEEIDGDALDQEPEAHLNGPK